MLYQEEEYLLLSGIQHFLFCAKQWGLIHVEQSWEENVDTVRGQLFHTKADSQKREKRGELLTVRSLPVHSRRLGFYGICDIVEFYQDESGVPLFGEPEKYIPFPVEYKKGKPKAHDGDIVQLVAQSLCLEEMLGTTINQGAIFYGENRRRTDIEITEERRAQVFSLSEKMHDYFRRGITPKSKYSPVCKRCSLYNICLPLEKQTSSVNNYIQKSIEEGEV